MMDDAYFMQAALEEARRALAAGEFPVGCVVVSKGRVIVRSARQGSRSEHPSEIDHAEMLALRHLENLNEDIIREDVAIYTTMEPCLMCFAAVTLSRIGKVVYAYEDAMGGGTNCNLHSLPPLYRTLRPQVIGGVLRSESLALFKAFFRDPSNTYWQGSLLETYTTEQAAG
jgi:tRNA(adenine34) deaminase